MRSKKSWSEKMLRPSAAEIVVLEKPMSGVPAGARMLISTPREIEELVRSIPAGACTSVPLLRRELARRHQVETSCPLTTGIFLRIVAEAAEEARRAGAASVAPYWRVLQANGRHLPKLPGGEVGQKALLDDDLKHAFGS